MHNLDLTSKTRTAAFTSPSSTGKKMSESASESGCDNDVVFTTATTGNSTSLTSTSTPSSSPIYYGNFSLAEHSYCASLGLASPGGNHAGEEGGGQHSISDGGSVDLIPGGEFYVEYPGEEDVNFDGSNFAIPLSVEDQGHHHVVGLENCGGVTMELGSSREEEENRDGLNFVEIPSSSSSSSGRPAKVKVETKKRNGILGKYSKPRRRDYIDKPSEREKHFEDIIKRLALQLHRTIGRTGCEGELSAVYDGKVFNANPIPVSSSSPSSSSPGNPAFRIPSATIIPCTATSTVEVDDHRYAAPILTQNASSSVVWDHQYAYPEKTPSPSGEGRSIDCEEDSEECDIVAVYSNEESGKRKRVQRFDYIKSEAARDQILCKLAKSLFSQTIKLEQRTGAKIYLLLKYGRCIINDKNYQDCPKLIASSKKAPVQEVLKPLAPNLEKPMPLTFILPGFPHPIQIPEPTSVRPLYSNPSSAPVYQVVPPHQSANDLFFPFYANSNVMLQQNQSSSTDHPVQVQPDLNGTGGTSGGADIPVFESSQNDTSYNYSAFDPNFSNEGSPQQQTVTTSSIVGSGSAVETKSSSTNTEPICSICQNGEQSSSSGCSSKAGNVFWIRCNDPFCYDMVHASCVGFLVTHAAHLRQLPPFYCKLHR